MSWLKNAALIAGWLLLLVLLLTLGPTLRDWAISEGYRWWHGMIVAAIVVGVVLVRAISALERQVNALHTRIAALEREPRR